MKNAVNAKPSRSKSGNVRGYHWMIRSVLLLPFLLTLLGCSATPSPPQIVPIDRVVFTPVQVPESLLQPNQVDGDFETYGDAVDLAISALSKLGECNADKLKIQEWNHAEVP